MGPRALGINRNPAKSSGPNPCWTTNAPRPERCGSAQPTQTSATSNPPESPRDSHRDWGRCRHCDPPSVPSRAHWFPRTGASRPMQTWWRTALDLAAIFLIGVYRNTLSIMMLHSCRFSPTCSEYARGAINRHGIFRGVKLTLLRLIRCRPGGAFGFDPVK